MPTFRNTVSVTSYLSSSYGWVTGFCSLNANVSEHCVCSIFLPTGLWRKCVLKSWHLISPRRKHTTLSFSVFFGVLQGGLKLCYTFCRKQIFNLLLWPQHSEHQSHFIPTRLWRWNRQGVPKCWYLNYRRRWTTQKRAYNMYSAFGKSLCTYKRCWEWFPQASIQARTRLIVFANAFCRSAFGKSLCTYKSCWKWCPRASIQAWTRLILFANTFCRSAFAKSLCTCKRCWKWSPRASILTTKSTYRSLRAQRHSKRTV
jgi:hypothetical protein